ncbi:PAAR domain-containing protein [Rhizobium sp. 9T]|uniref:PAAR domain-containing protein n=1 Tax=Rhizobium croatiense TaxID=2867516 RepID=UPI001C93717C|nr:PAAR domain-containing protein [Rhizobium croatiense]MBY4611381.1 PAAR domain-containing protein [Rhizobium croatiense]
MVGRPVTLKGHMHVCPMVDPGPRPHVGGPVSSTSQSFVCVEGVPIATVGDRCTCTGVPTTAGVTSGSSIANIGGKKVARFGDACEHGGRLVQGVPWLTFD